MSDDSMVNDMIRPLVASLTRCWREERTGGKVRAGDVVRIRDGDGVERVVVRVDETVEPAAALCGFRGPGPGVEVGDGFWSCRWVPVDDLVVVWREVRAVAGEDDDVAEAIALAVNVALARDDPETAAALIVLRMRRGQGPSWRLAAVSTLVSAAGGSSWSAAGVGRFAPPD